MSRSIPFSRHGATGRVLAGAVVLLLCGGAVDPPATARIGRFIATRTDTPPEVLSRTRNVREASLMTEPVLKQSGIREIRDFRTFLDKLARKTSDKTELATAVNEYVNVHVRFTPDDNLYNKNDVWAPPINTLILGGDCEDIALVKYWGLHYVGFAREDMFLVVGMSSVVNPPAGHAILSVRLPDGSFLALDSLERRVLSVDEMTRFEPAYAVGVDGYWTVNDSTRDWGEYWRVAFKKDAERQGR